MGENAHHDRTKALDAKLTKKTTRPIFTESASQLFDSVKACFITRDNQKGGGMAKWVTMFCLLVLGLGTPAHGDNLNFQTTAEGITSSLLRAAGNMTAKDHSMREIHNRKIRSVQYVGKEPKRIHKTVNVPYDLKSRGVNLNIKFDYDSYQIRYESYPLLNELGKALTDPQIKNRRIAIIGHTDSDGELQYNYRLSLNRAKAVKRFLVANFQIDKQRLKVLGYGESQPLVTNMSEVNKQINRRVEIGLAD